MVLGPQDWACCRSRYSSKPNVPVESTSSHLLLTELSQKAKRRLMTFLFNHIVLWMMSGEKGVCVGRRCEVIVVDTWKGEEMPKDLPFTVWFVTPFEKERRNYF